MGVSMRAYGRHRGVSDTAVRKAIKSGRISLEDDGTIDVDKADREWTQNTHQKKTVPKAALDAVDETLRESGGANGATFMQARTANEVIKAQTNRVKLQQLKKELVDRSTALAHVFRLARTERDAWQSWPSRISSQMAADLDVDAHKLHTLLEKYVRQHLQELAEIQPKVD